MTAATADELAADRVRRLLNRPGAYIVEETQDLYALRVLRDRRRPPVLMFDDLIYRALLQNPGLAARAEGGWRPTRAWVESAPPAVSGRPGEVMGERVVVDEGERVVRRANLTPSALDWLASRKEASGQPWLTSAQVAAAQRLREDHRRGGAIGRLTMDWRLTPRSGSSTTTYDDPAQAAVEARRRVTAALGALTGRGRLVVERLCLADLSLREVEAGLGLASRSARPLLQAALDVLARHYGLR